MEKFLKSPYVFFCMVFPQIIMLIIYQYFAKKLIFFNNFPLSGLDDMTLWYLFTNCVQCLRKTSAAWLSNPIGRLSIIIAPFVLFLQCTSTYIYTHCTHHKIIICRIFLFCHGVIYKINFYLPPSSMHAVFTTKNLYCSLPFISCLRHF